jgi:hypothetical protein
MRAFYLRRRAVCRSINARHRIVTKAKRNSTQPKRIGRASLYAQGVYDVHVRKGWLWGCLALVVASGCSSRHETATSAEPSDAATNDVGPSTSDGAVDTAASIRVCVTVECADVFQFEGTFPDSAAGTLPLDVKCCHSVHCETGPITPGAGPPGASVNTELRVGTDAWATVVIWSAEGGNRRITVSFLPNQMEPFKSGDTFSYVLSANDGTVILHDQVVVDYDTKQLGCGQCPHAIPRK